jgi:Pyruvate/2-oxoacid:ferredoxin oxidoreductase gamma subunit
LDEEVRLKSYQKKGMDVVELNYKAIDAGAEGLREIKS